jgi:hypothetical protein
MRTLFIIGWLAEKTAQSFAGALSNEMVVVREQCPRLQRALVLSRECEKAIL